MTDSHPATHAVLHQQQVEVDGDQAQALYGHYILYADGVLRQVETVCRQVQLQLAVMRLFCAGIKIDNKQLRFVFIFLVENCSALPRLGSSQRRTLTSLSNHPHKLLWHFQASYKANFRYEV